MIDISVVIPAFRPQCFASLIRSRDLNSGDAIEWIVVDDGSGGAYDDVFATLPDGIRLIRHPENRRQGAARNAGLAQAQGQWVKFLDADDQLDAGHLDALVQASGQDQTIAFALTRHIFANGTMQVNDSWRDLPADSGAQFRRQLVRPFLHHCGALFPRQLLLDMGGYDESLLTDEDGDLLLRIMREGWRFNPVEGVYYLYIHHGAAARVSADDDIAKMRSRIRTCDKVAAAEGGQMSPSTAEALAQRMDKIAMTYWTAFPAESRALLVRARSLSPRYQLHMRGPLRLLRRAGGPAMVFAAQGLYRRVKGRPKGGAQG